MISFTLDGRTVQVVEGNSVLQGALANGVHIPHLCHHPELRPSGGCRLCMVELAGRPNPAASCGLTAEEGMVVTSQSERLTEIRREIIDRLVSDHP